MPAFEVLGMVFFPLESKYWVRPRKYKIKDDEFPQQMLSRVSNLILDPKRGHLTPAWKLDFFFFLRAYLSVMSSQFLGIHGVQGKSWMIKPQDI